jgi:hypothetical protein
MDRIQREQGEYAVNGAAVEVFHLIDVHEFSGASAESGTAEQVHELCELVHHVPIKKLSKMMDINCFVEVLKRIWFL